MSVRYTATNRPLFIVTGSGRGFGRALTIAALQRQARVLSISRSPTRNPLTDTRHVYYVADCSRAQDLDSVWPEVGCQLRAASDVIVINNAGYYIKHPLRNDDGLNICRTIESNVLAAAAVTRRVLDVVAPAAIVNIVSTSGLDVAVPRSDLKYKAAYSGAKRILAELTDAMIDQVPPSVRVLNIYPRNINTWSDEIEPDSIDRHDLAEWIVDQSLCRCAWHLTTCVVLPVR